MKILFHFFIHAIRNKTQKKYLSISASSFFISLYFSSSIWRLPNADIEVIDDYATPVNLNEFQLTEMKTNVIIWSRQDFQTKLLRYSTLRSR